MRAERDVKMTPIVAGMRLKERLRFEREVLEVETEWRQTIVDTKDKLVLAKNTFFAQSGC